MKNAYTCPDCQIEQDDALIESGNFVNNPDDGWYNYHCPSCGAIITAELLEECGILPS